jgi:hypothetical protein
MGSLQTKARRLKPKSQTWALEERKTTSTSLPQRTFHFPFRISDHCLTSHPHFAYSASPNWHPSLKEGSTASLGPSLSSASLLSSLCTHFIRTLNIIYSHIYSIASTYDSTHREYDLNQRTWTFLAYDFITPFSGSFCSYSTPRHPRDRGGAGLIRFVVR